MVILSHLECHSCQLVGHSTIIGITEAWSLTARVCVCFGEQLSLSLGLLCWFVVWLLVQGICGVFVMDEKVVVYGRGSIWPGSTVCINTISATCCISSNVCDRQQQCDSVEHTGIEHFHLIYICENCKQNTVHSFLYLCIILFLNVYQH